VRRNRFVRYRQDSMISGVLPCGVRLYFWIAL
jgi:hypothetical protein